MKMKFNVAVLSDVGLVRDNNEDNFYVPHMQIKRMQEPYYEGTAEFTASRAYMCVCDGMGGHSSGEVASYMAAKETEKAYMELTDESVKNKKRMDEVMQRFIAETNDRIYGRTEHDGRLRTMGTTMTGLYFLKNGAYFVNVGDSRSYEIRKRGAGQLSTDHADPSSKNAITRYLGMSAEYGRMDADIAFLPSKIGMGRRYLLCSDGLTDMVDDKIIAAAMMKHKDSLGAARELVNEAKRAGGHDNITVAVIDVKPAGAAKVVYNKVAVICAAAAIAAGSAGGGIYLLKPDRTPGGESLTAITTTVTNAKNLREAEEAADSILIEAIGNAEYFENFAAGVTEDDNTVRIRNGELMTAASQLREKITAFSDRLEEIKAMAIGDQEKMELIKAMTSDTVYAELEAAVADCGTKKLLVEEQQRVYAAHLQWLAEEERRAQEAAQHQEETDSSSHNSGSTGGNESSSNSSSNSSSGSGGSSGGGSGSGGSSGSGSGGGSSESGGGTSGGGGISNVDTQPKNPSTEGGIRLQPESGGNDTSGNSNSNR